MSDLIKRMAHVALRVPDLDASLAWATTVMGLRVVERDAGAVYLTHGTCHHSLQLIESDRALLDHIALEAHDDDALERVAHALAGRGIGLVSEAPEERGLRNAIRFRGPDGHLIEVFTGMDEAGPAETGRGVRPRKFGHPMLTAPDTRATRALFQEALGFRLSDDVGDGTLVFMRCGFDHHGIGIGQGPVGFNHYAWEVENLGVLGLLCETVAENGGRIIWGPGRHGAGRNLFTYHFDPAGFIVEYYADLYRVWDERTYEPGHWSLDDHRFANLWGPGPPLEMMETAVPVA